MPARSFEAQNPPHQPSHSGDSTCLPASSAGRGGHVRLLLARLSNFVLPQSQSPARLAFGPFEVNVQTGQLLNSGVRIRLSGQPFQILLILLAHPGDVVTNEQLCEQILEGRDVRRFRARPPRCRQQASAGVGRFGRESAVHRNRTGPRIPIHRGGGSRAGANPL